MALDPYQPCLCGSGKKLKFCCGDIAAELEKIDRMIQGEQYAAALSHLRTLTAKHKDRASLLGMQAMLETHQEEFDAARKTLSHLIVKHPEGSRGWAELAILEAVASGGKAGVEPLQRALETLQDQTVPVRVYLAIGVVAQALLEEGEAFAARGHFTLQASMAPEEDTRASYLLFKMNRSPEIPLLMKETPRFSEPPADAPWKTDYLAAIRAASQCKWREAERILTPLAQKATGQPHLWRSIGAMKAYLADGDGAAEALRRFSRSEVPLEDAVEAAALASFLDTQGSDAKIDVVHVPRVILDREAVETALLSSDQVERMPMAPGAFPETDGPPPVATYALFDKPLIKSAADQTLTLDQIPNSLGQAYLFGRETDREARLELVVRRDLLPEMNKLLDELGGNNLGQLGEERVLTVVSQLESVLSWRWRLPPDISLAQRRELIAAKTRVSFLKQWPELSLRSLGGKTPREAAKDPAQKIPLLANILQLDLGTGAANRDFDFNELRRELGLPELGTVDPSQFVKEPIPLARLARLDVAQLSDDQLVEAYSAAEMFDVRAALKPLGEEILRRESCHDKLPLAMVYGTLSGMQDSPDEAAHLLHKAAELTKAAGRSTVSWELAELELWLIAGNAEKSQAVLKQITRNHLQEPGVREQLMQLLMDFGVIGPDGRPAGPMPSSGASMPLAEPPASEPAGGIWTPDGGAAATGQKSKLWIPGAD